MPSGLAIKIVDPDDDYLEIEIHASNDRFAGTSRIYTGLDQLSEFAAQIAAFLQMYTTRRYMSLVLASRLTPPCDIVGCASTASIGRGTRRSRSPSKMMTGYTRGTAELSFQIEAAAIDRIPN